MNTVTQLANDLAACSLNFVNSSKTGESEWYLWAMMAAALVEDCRRQYQIWLQVPGPVGCRAHGLNYLENIYFYSSRLQYPHLQKEDGSYSSYTSLVTGRIKDHNLSTFSRIKSTVCSRDLSKHWA